MNSPDSPGHKKIVWLASYPKSGNTWFRAFLTALLGDDGDIDINELKTDGIFSSRNIFDNTTDIDSTYLCDDEAKLLLPEVFEHIAANYAKERLFVKIHDAYSFNPAALPIVPNRATLCALYFIRNPLDIAASLANHNASTIDDAIRLMNSDNGALAKQPGNLNISNQFKQLLYSWSGHVESWTNPLPFPVMVIRYEDMLTDTLNTFSKAVSFIGLDVGTEKIKKAVAESSFENLKNKEKEKGFAEKNNSSTSFFRKGTAGNWVSELSAQQIELITQVHQKKMNLYNY